MVRSHRWVTPCLIAAAWTGIALAEPVTVRHPEGALHGFLALKTLAGETLADGDLVQLTQGDRVTSRTIFHFRDGSLLDEIVVFSQEGHFRLVSDHLVQKGPRFPVPMEVSIDAASGRVVVRYRDKDGKDQVDDEKMELPADLANGLLLTLVRNLGASSSATVSFVAASPKPRLVKMAIGADGTDPFFVGSASQKASRLVVKVEIGGVAGLVAPLVGKKPVDTHVWLLAGDVPAFLRSEGPLYFGGPVWRVEPTVPSWTQTAAGR
ncbi:MAG TPA: hypothetical protein VJA66_05110 [Thermoanaerobaculia bacterium]